MISRLAGMLPLSTRILGTALLVLLIVLIVQNRSGDPPNTIAAPPVPSDPVEIEISSAGKTILLVGSDGRWYLEPEAGEDEMVAGDPDAVDRVLDELRALGRLPVVSVRGNLGEYGLEEPTQRTLVVRGGEGEPDLLVELGYSASGGDAVYGRVGAGREIVRFPRALHHAISTSRDDYRDMRVASIPEEHIRRITILGENHRPLLVEPAVAEDAGTGEFAWEVRGAGETGADVIRQERVRDLLRELAPLRAVAFLRRGDRGTEGDPFATLEILMTEGRSHRIELYPPDGERRFPARSTMEAYPFYLPEWRVRRLLLGVESYLEPFMEDPPPMM